MTQNRSNFADAYRKMYEKLKPSDGAGAYIDDFRKSDAPQFKGKSDKKIQKMAVAAYLDDKDKAKKEDKDMDPAKHVARSKKNPDKFCVFDKDGNEVKLFDKKDDAVAYAKANHDKLMEELEYVIEQLIKAKTPQEKIKTLVKMDKLKSKASRIMNDKDKAKKMANDLNDLAELEESQVFVVRFTDPKNKKRFAVPYKDKKSADDKMKQLKRDGVKEIEVTKDVLKRGVKFKEQYELQEAKFAVKLSFLPKPIYMDSESAGKVKVALRKALKKPDDLESVERVMPADYKADLRNRIKGKKDDEDGEEQKEALDKKDEPFVKDLIKNLRSGSKTHGKQADDLEKALKTEAANPAQQAAIAISMKKAGKKPKSEMDEGIKPYVSMQRKNGKMNYVVLDKNEKEVYRSTDERLAKDYLRKNFRKLREDTIDERFKPEGGELFVVTAGPGDNAQKVIGMDKNLRKAQKMRNDYDRKNKPSKPSHKARVYAQSKESQPRNKFKVGDDIKYSSYGNKLQFTKVKEMKFDEPEFSKKNFAMNRIGLVAKDLKKKELGKVTDEGRKSKYDMDQDDEEGANKNIIMQLRKSVDLKGRFDVEFEDGKKVKVKDTIARAAVLKHAGMKRPAEKLAFQKKIEKSYRDLLNAIKGR